MVGAGSRREQAGQLAGPVVALQVLGSQGVVGLVVGRARFQASAGEHDIPFIHPDLGHIVAPVRPANRPQEQHDDESCQNRQYAEGYPFQLGR